MKKYFLITFLILSLFCLVSCPKENASSNTNSISNIEPEPTQETEPIESSKIPNLPEELDWDQDGLTNIDEVTVWYTNPYDKDTDGDGYSDYIEAMTMYDETTNKFNPLIADIPIIKIQITEPPIITKITEETTGTSHSTNISEGTTGTSGRSETQSNAHSASSESNWNAGVYAEGQVGSSDSHFKWGGTFNFGHKWASGDTYTYSTSSNKSLSESYAKSVADSSTYSEVLKGGTLTVPVKIINDSDISFTVESIMLTAYGITTETDKEHTNITNLYVDPVAADPTKLTATIPAHSESGEIRFSSGTFSVALLKKLLVNSSGIYAAVATQSITLTGVDGAKHDFTATTTNVGAKTVAITIDYGPSINRNYEQAHVVTRLVEASGFTNSLESSIYVNRSLKDVLTIMLGENIEFVETAQYKMIKSIRGISDSKGNANTNGKWFISHTTNVSGKTVEKFYSSFVNDKIDQRYNVDEIPVYAGDVIDIVYSVDKDNDGLSLRLETLYGTSDELPDSDGDGIEDLKELVGWSHTEDGEVFITNPASNDTDGDGVKDKVDDNPLVPNNLSLTNIKNITLSFQPFNSKEFSNIQLHPSFEHISEGNPQKIDKNYDNKKEHLCCNLNAGELKTSTFTLHLDKVVNAITVKCYIISGVEDVKNLSREEYSRATEIPVQADGTFRLENTPTEPFKVLLKVTSADETNENWISILVSTPLQSVTSFTLSSRHEEEEVAVSTSWAKIIDSRITGLLLVRKDNSYSYNGPSANMIRMASVSTGGKYDDKSHGLQITVINPKETMILTSALYSKDFTFYLYAYQYDESSNTCIFSEGVSQSLKAILPEKFSVTVFFDTLTLTDTKGDAGDEAELLWRFYYSVDSKGEECFHSKTEEWEAEPIATYAFNGQANTPAIKISSSEFHNIQLRFNFEEVDGGANPNDIIDRYFSIGYNKSGGSFWASSQFIPIPLNTETEFRLDIDSDDCMAGYLKFRILIKPTT